MKRVKDVQEYINTAPAEYRESLRELRTVIKKIAPRAVERISYGMPYYHYNGRLAYFAAMNGYIGLYIPPPVITNHSKELALYATTKSAIHLPIKKLPFPLIRKLIKARIIYLESDK